MTPAYLFAAGWKTALGAFQVGSDLSRAMLQILGPGMGTADTSMVEVLNDFVRSGRLPELLRSHDVTQIGTATQNLLNIAARAQSMAELDADLDNVLRTYAPPGQPVDSEKRAAFARDVWEAGRASRGRTAGT